MKKLLYLIIFLVITFPVYGQQLTRPSYHQGFARSAGESASDLWTGLIGAWCPSLGVTGFVLRDVSKLGSHGSFHASMTMDDWVVGKEAIFYDTSNNEYIDCAAIVDEDYFDMTATDSFSIAVRFQAQEGGSNYRTIIAKASLGSTAGYSIYLDTIHGIDCQIREGGTIASIDSGVSADDGNFHTAVMTVNRGTETLTLYVDGVSKGTADTSSVGSIVNIYRLMIGTRESSGTQYYFDGWIGNTCIWRDRVLTANEAQDFHRDPVAMFRRKDSFMFSVPEAPAPSGTTSSIHWLQ